VDVVALYTEKYGKLHITIITALMVLDMTPCTCSEPLGGGGSKQLLDSPALLEHLPTDLLYPFQMCAVDAVCLASQHLFCFSIPSRCTTAWGTSAEETDTIPAFCGLLQCEMRNFFCCYEINQQISVLSKFLPLSSSLESVAGSFCPHQDIVICILKCMAGCSSPKLCIRTVF